jgi:hypothetical protein
MRGEVSYIDISGSPELLQLAEEVRSRGKPAVLRRGGDEMAVVSPIRKPRTRRSPSKADYEAFLSSLGGWKDLVDTDKLLKDIAESRRLSTRPPVDL